MQFSEREKTTLATMVTKARKIAQRLIHAFLRLLDEERSRHVFSDLLLSDFSEISLQRFLKNNLAISLLVPSRYIKTITKIIIKKMLNKHLYHFLLVLYSFFLNKSILFS